MMIRSLTLQSSSSSALFLQAKDPHGTKPSSKFASSTISCSSSSSSSSSSSKGDGYHHHLPKLEPFSRTKFDRAVNKDLPLIEKSENDLSEYCSTLEGDTSYSCWKAYFELKDLEKESPKADVERLILQAGGVKSLIGFLHGIAAIHKAKKEVSELPKPISADTRAEKPCPVPDGLPKSQKEMEEEEEARMPDSPFTRMLRNKGRFPAWFSPVPDHETD